jgi:tetratricopeptide (TPR) repeat protein
VLGTVDRALTAYRSEWMAMHTSACEATRVRGEQSEAMLDRRMGCLADRRRAVAALTTVLARGGRDVLDGAADAAARLPSIDGCADVRALAARVPPPEGAAQRGAVARAAGPIAEANALIDLALPARGLAVLAAAEAPARESGYAPIEARRLFVKGLLEYLAGDLSSGEESLHAAALAAEAAGDDGLLADVWTLLGRLVGSRRYRPAEGRRWLAYAEAALRRAGGDDERESARLYALSTVAHAGEGRPEEAHELLSKARGLMAQRCAKAAPEERSGSLRCASLLELDGALAGFLSDMGQTGEAIPIFERVRAARAETHGPGARWVTLAMMNEGEALCREGRPAEGLDLLLRARALEQQAGRFADEGFVGHRVADALRRLGRFEEALAEDRASADAIRRAQGGENIPLAWPLTGEGEDLVALGRAREAIAPLERAVALREGSPAAIAEIAASRFALARALWEGGGDRARALSLAEEARAAIAPAAAAHDGWIRHTHDDIDAWLAAHPGSARAR